ncbi:MAG: hypothetical protein HYX50_05600 [Chloroflexi bacterium]|nr:hypothetical protein [Chloroflexota bacterium]
MSTDMAHERRHLQERVADEIARATRYGHQFGLLVFEAVPGGDQRTLGKRCALGLETVRGVLRACDHAAQVHEDVVVALLIETDARGLRDALQRLRSALARHSGGWRVTALHFPEQAAAISELPMLRAA